MNKTFTSKWISSFYAFLLGGLHVGWSNTISGNQFQYISRAINPSAAQLQNDWYLTTSDANYIFTNFSKIIYLNFNIHGIVLAGIILNGLGFLYLTKIGILFLNHNNKSLPFLFPSVLALTLSNFTLEIDWGLAGMGVFSPSLQPSSFGIFLIVAIYYLIKHCRDLNAISKNHSNFRLFNIYLLIAATFHPSLIISGVILYLSFLLSIIKKRKLNSYHLYAAFSTLVIISLFNLRFIWATLRSQGLEFQEAQYFLAIERIPYHAVPTYFMGLESTLRVIIIIIFVALFSHRYRAAVETLFFQNLAIITIIILLSQYFAFNPAISLSLPWRITGLLYPLAVAYILVDFFNFIGEKHFEKVKTCFYLLILLLLAVSNTRFTVLLLLIVFLQLFKKAIVSIVILTSIMIFTFFVGFQNQSQVDSAWKQSKDIFISSKDLSEVRNWGAGVVLEEFSNLRSEFRFSLYVDYKSVPFFPDDLVEWVKRINTARDLLSNPSQLCVSEILGVQWIMIPNESKPNCFKQFFSVQDGNFSFVRLRE